MIISDNSISQFQALVQLTENKQYYVFEDNESLNGTHVNNNKISNKPI